MKTGRNSLSELSGTMEGEEKEGDLVHSEPAVEDFNGSGDSVADPVRLDLCGDCLCLRFGAGAYQHGGCPAGCAVLITYSLQNGIILLVISISH